MPDASPIILVSRQRLVGANNGSSTYLIALARSMREAGHPIHLVQPSPVIAGRTPLLRLRPEMDVFASHKVRGAVRIGRMFVFSDPGIWRDAILGTLRKVARRLGAKGGWTTDRPRPYSIATEWTASDRKFLASHVPARPAAIVADYMFSAPSFDAVQADVPKAIVMHDLFHSREGGGQDSVALVGRDEEVAMLSRADLVIAIQAAEMRFVEEELRGVRGLLAPMPAQPVSAPAAGEDDRVLFVGSNTAPNSVGLAWFCENVWPDVLAARPNCRLDVVGSVGRAFDAAQYRNVQFHGLVDDLEPFYRRAGVVISPLTFGSGLKIKLIEGLAAGKAMVVTGVTLQGVEDPCEGAVIRADQPTDFATALSDLAGSHAARLALATEALSCAERHFSAQSAHADLRRWVGSLA